MKRNLESIKDLKFQALEKTQMMKILGGDCRTRGGTRTHSNGDSYKFSGDTSHDNGTKSYQTGSNDVSDLDWCEGHGDN